MDAIISNLVSRSDRNRRVGKIMIIRNSQATVKRNIQSSRSQVTSEQLAAVIA